MEGAVQSDFRWQKRAKSERIIIENRRKRQRPLAAFRRQLPSDFTAEITSQKRGKKMASTKKFTHDAMSSQNGHIDREHDSPKNPDIDPKRTHLNYSFPTIHDDQKPFEYYKNRISEVYMYGRYGHGTEKREKAAITGCGWIVTLPKELYGSPEKEKAFFQGVYDFISSRYGEENIINNSVHYDEGGLPHIHVIFAPITTLNPDLVQYKTRRTKQAIKLPSGRYEYRFIHVDKNGKAAKEDDPSTWVRINNYDHKTERYKDNPFKVDCNSVINPIELKHFHPDLQQYLTDHGIEGKVVTGKTGTNFSVKELKDFTKKTGLRIDDVKAMLQDGESILQAFAESQEKIVHLTQELHEKSQKIESLSMDLSTKKTEIKALNQSIEKMKTQITELKKSVETKKQESSHIKSNVTETQTQEQTKKRIFSWSKPKSIEHEQEVTL